MIACCISASIIMGLLTTASVPVATAKTDTQANTPLTILVDGTNQLTGSGNAAQQIAAEKKLKNLTLETGISQIGYNSYLNNVMQKDGITLYLQNWGWAEPLIQKEDASFVAKQGPDVITGETQSPGYAARGVLTPFPKWLADYIRKNVVPAAWEPMEYNGQIYGVADQPGIDILYWNKTLLKKAGLNPNVGPKTWTQWVDMIAKVSAAGHGKFWGGGLYAGPGIGTEIRLGAMIKEAGGDLVTNGVEPNFTNKGMNDVLSLVREMSKYNPKSLELSSDGPWFSAWDKNQLAFVIDGPWQYSGSIQNGMDIGYSALPASPSGNLGNMTIGAAFESVPVYAKHKDAAFKYIAALVSPGFQKLVAKYNIRPVVLKSIGNSAWYKKNYPVMYTFLKSMSGNVRGMPTFAGNNTQIWSVFDNAVGEAVMTNTPISQILSQAQQQASQFSKKS